jgi:Family of unknown function (DUF6918)
MSEQEQTQPPLLELLTAGPNRQRVIQDCVRLIDAEVASKSGLKSMPLKAGFKVVKGLRPGFIASAVDFLLDDFCRALAPFYDDWVKDKASAALQTMLVRHQDTVSNALLGVTDQRAERSQHATIRKVYYKLRPTAQKHVAAALPGLGRTIEPYLKDAAIKAIKDAAGGGGAGA